jgi:hypothetical protein
MKSIYRIRQLRHAYAGSSSAARTAVGYGFSGTAFACHDHGISFDFFQLHLQLALCGFYFGMELFVEVLGPSIEGCRCCFYDGPLVDGC